MKRIGILGGMGPVASAYLYTLLLKKAHYKYDAKYDTDFPQIVINSISLSDFDQKGYINKKTIIKELYLGLRLLERSKVDFIAIDCNTVHIFYSIFREKLNTPILNIIDLTKKEIVERSCKKVGVLGSSTTKSFALLTSKLDIANIGYLETTPKEQVDLDSIIYDVMSQSITNDTYKKMIRILERMTNSGAESVVLGCTELSLLYDKLFGMFPLMDSSEILAEEILKLAYND